jgi:glycosyltransferase involved in cell wall biosynthesis
MISGLQDITVLITSFLRPGYLTEALSSIRRNSDAQIVVADDSGNEARSEGWIYLPFDSGLPAKRNACVEMTRTKYALLGCDDFDFTEDAMAGVVRMREVLEAHPDVDVVVGRYGNNPYEGFLEWVEGSHIKETRLETHRTAPLYTEPYPVWKIDIGVNFFLARTSALREIPWDTRYKIGGEHGDWFLDLKLAGKLVVFLPGANINPQRADNSKQDPRYGAFRGRCWDGHYAFKAKRNVKHYIDFGGGVS